MHSGEIGKGKVKRCKTRHHSDETQVHGTGLLSDRYNSPAERNRCQRRLKGEMSSQFIQSGGAHLDPGSQPRTFTSVWLP